MLLQVFLLFAFVLYAALIMYYYKSWIALKEFKAGDQAPSSISVIVPARNEEARIGALLKALQAQTYPADRFEIIVVDDFSTDGTAQTVRNNALSNLKLIHPDTEASASSKKKAIESGIRAAKGELIVCTDADCVPGPLWLQTHNSFYRSCGASFIAAPVRFSHDGSLLQIFQAMDFITLQGITAAAVAADFHTMCNGANLAYRKESFINVNGFEGIDTVATGDDMLLMHKIWKQEPGKVLYLKSRDAIVSTEPMTTWKDLFMQRKRWASKTFVYDDKKILGVLIFVYIWNCVFPALLIAACFDSHYLLYAASFWFAKTLVELPFFRSVAGFYGEKKLAGYFFILQPLHIFYTVAVGLISQFGKYEWKGRKTK